MDFNFVGKRNKVRCVFADENTPYATVLVAV